MKPKIDVRIQTNDFDIDSEIGVLTKNQFEIGAVTIFIGLVRDLSEKKDLRYMDLEHYPGMTEKALENICNEAAQRWKILGLTVIHRVGRLFPGDNIVLVLVSSKHRGDAYNSNEFIMDFLKSNAPIWKKETSKVGSYWVGARTSDIDSLKATRNG